jgi:predicted permease
VLVALRRLLRSPGFAALAVGILALGFAAALTILEVANAVLLRPLAFASNPDQLVIVSNLDESSKTRITVAGADYLDWKASGALKVTAMSARGFTLGGDRPERAEGAIVATDYFDLLGVTPALGSVPAERAAVLSDGLWRVRYGEDRSIVGRTITIDDEPVLVAGVMPPSFQYPANAQLWVTPRVRVPEHPTYPIDPQTDRQRHYLTVIGRLGPSQTLEQAQSAMQVVQARLQKDHPDDERGIGIQLVPLREQLFGSAKPLLYVLLSVAALLFAIAWANAAQLFLARAIARSHEVAVRTALGATRSQVWRLFFSESLLVGALAAFFGLVIASQAAPLLVASSPQAASLPKPSLDAQLIAMAALLVLLCGASLGLFAALHPRLPAEALQEGGRTGTGGRKSARLRSAFLTFEVALSVVLLVGAGLLLRSFRQVAAVDPGFAPGPVLAADIPLSRATHPTPASQAQFAGEVLRRLRADPLVEAAGFISRLPLSPSNTVGDLIVPGRENESFPCDFRLASDGYFEALHIPLREGRTLLPEDPNAVILNEAAARRAFPGQSAIGKRVYVWGEKEPHEVVGVVGNVRHVGLEAEPRPEAYRPLGAIGWPNLSLAVRGKVPPAQLAHSVREAVWAVDRQQPIVRLEPMVDRVGASLALRRFILALLSATALAAGLLAVAGIHGVTGYLVAQRTRELGVRLALGATPSRLLQQVTGETMARVAVGCVIGLGAAAGLTRLLRSFLYGVSPLDPMTFALVTLTLAAFAGLATAAAAFRATRVDPAHALRN